MLCFYFSQYLSKKGIKFSVKIYSTKPQDAFSYNSLTRLDCDFFGKYFQHFVFLCHPQFGGNPKCFLQCDGQVNTIPSLLQRAQGGKQLTQIMQSVWQKYKNFSERSYKTCQKWLLHVVLSNSSLCREQQHDSSLFWQETSWEEQLSTTKQQIAGSALPSSFAFPQLSTTCQK